MRAIVVLVGLIGCGGGKGGPQDAPVDVADAAIADVPGGGLFDVSAEFAAVRLHGLVDLNGDTRDDIVTTALGADKLEVRLGNVARGSDVVPTLFEPAIDVKLADVTGDGMLDVLVSDVSSSRVHVLRGLGGGSFETTPKTLAATGNLGTIAVGAFDGNAGSDLLVASESSTMVALYRGNGDGSFASTPSTFDAGIAPLDLYAADLDADGDTDLVVTSRDVEAISVLLNAGNGTFTESIRFDDPAKHLVAFDLDIVDFDDDGKLDLVFPASIDLYFAKNLGAGAFELTRIGSNRQSPDICDLDGDGHLDNVGALFDEIVISYGKGDGTIDHDTKVPADDVDEVRCGDHDGDGKRDLAVRTRSSGKAAVFYGR